MAKKKKSQRKRNFAYSAGASQPKTKVEPVITKSDDATKPATEKKVNATAAEADSLDYLRHDLKMILSLAIACVALEVLLWFLLHHTGLGKIVYGI